MDTSVKTIAAGSVAALPPPPEAPPQRGSLHQAGGRFGSDFFLSWTTRASALLVLFMLASLLIILTRAALPSFKAFGLKFLVTSEWQPNSPEQPLLNPDGTPVMQDGQTVMVKKPPVFGALPVIFGTAVSSLLALMLAVPLSFGAALFLVRIAPRLLAGPISFLVEFLAAIPSIAYGLWGLFILTPFLSDHFEPWCAHLYDSMGQPRALWWMFNETLNVGGEKITRELPLGGQDLLCGGIILAIMIVPIITAIGRDVLKSVPRAQVEGTVALGATWWQSSWEMLRYSRSGLFGAVMLGLARAAGETMAVTMVIGNNSQIRASLFAPAQTMSSLLANEFREADTAIYRAALTEVALILLVMSLLFNIVARYLVVGRGSRTAAAH